MPASAADFVITRLFQAPRPRVWAAWTEPAQLARWFGPKGCATSVLRSELKPGGMLLARMDMPDGDGPMVKSIWGRFVYREIEPPSRLTWVQAFADWKGAITPSPFPGPWPLEWHSTVTFEERGPGATLVTLHQAPLDATEAERLAFIEARESMTGGWSGSFEVLDQVLG
ncbi:SRPBCC domain-containing protein [Acetobacteraceae bacterium H6797]|nr:SRPBCC domain-containing protein [Acetobacteraceae bacterium H6797]